MVTTKRTCVLESTYQFRLPYGVLAFRVSTGRKVNRNAEHIYTAFNLDVTIILTLGLKL